MKNKKMHAYTGGAVTVPLTVPSGTVSGDLVPLGTDGLYGWATTDRVTADQAAKGTGPQGLTEGQAGVFLPGIVASIRTAANAMTGIADFAKVYQTSAKALTATASGNTFVGYRLNATTLALRSN